MNQANSSLSTINLLYDILSWRAPFYNLTVPSAQTSSLRRLKKWMDDIKSELRFLTDRCPTGDTSVTKWTVSLWTFATFSLSKMRGTCVWPSNLHQLSAFSVDNLSLPHWCSRLSKLHQVFPLPSHVILVFI